MRFQRYMFFLSVSLVAYAVAMLFLQTEAFMLKS
mgnify:CR=1 FL=1